MSGAAPARARAPRVPQRERRRQLLDAALAVLAEDGFGALSMEAVARRAGVDRVVVYRSFPSLHLLLLALLRREQRRTERRLDALIPADPGGRDPRELLHAGVAGFLDAVAAEPLTWRLALLPPEGAPVAVRAAVDRRRAAAERRLRRLVEWGADRLAVPPHTIDAEVLSRMILSVCEEHGRLLLEGTFTRERLAESAQRLLAAVAWR
ncbi:MAG TPA: helix-turn-helix domain-containing protein [Solirubrobacteraceae bacterium]|nr:helix-turn-helix domain-containing protein [Solirubrobacteraceae bacterium]